MERAREKVGVVRVDVRVDNPVYVGRLDANSSKVFEQFSLNTVLSCVWSRAKSCVHDCDEVVRPKYEHAVVPGVESIWCE